MSNREIVRVNGFKIFENYREKSQNPLVKGGTTYYKLAYVYKPKVNAWTLFYAINDKNQVFLAAYPNDGTEVKIEKLETVNANEYGNPLSAAKIIYLAEMRIQGLTRFATQHAEAF